MHASASDELAVYAIELFLRVECHKRSLLARPRPADAAAAGRCCCLGGNEKWRARFRTLRSCSMARTKQTARKSTDTQPRPKVTKPKSPAKPILLKPEHGTCLLCEAPGVVFDDLAGGVLCAVHEQERRDTSPEDSAEALAARRKADAARAKALAAAVEAERQAAKRAAHEALLARAAAESSESEGASQPRDDVLLLPARRCACSTRCPRRRPSA